jgi:hypothetical protein
LTQQIDFDAENRKLYERFQNGSVSALEAMIKLNKPLAMKMANKYYHAANLEYRPSIDREDLEQMATVGVWQAIMSWEPERGVLSQVIVWKIKTEMREVFRVGKSVSLNTPVPGGEDRDTEQQDLIPDPGAVDPSDELYTSERCKEYFRFVEDQGAKPKELELLKAYCYGYGPQPALGAIRSCLITGPQTPVVKAFREKWLDNQVSYYPSPLARIGQIRITSSFADPTADNAIKRIELLERLQYRLNNKIRGA